MLCPLCDGQGILYSAKILKLNLLIYICDECDAMWETPDFRTSNSEQFGSFMRKNGLPELWTELSDVQEYKP